MKREKKFTLVLIIFAVCGLLLFLNGIRSIISFENYKKTAVETKAIIKDVGSVENQVRKFPIIEYDLNGGKHAAVLNYYDMSMKEGQELTIYYNTEDPDKIVLGKNNFMYLITPILGFIILVGSIIAIYIRKKNKE